MASAADQRSIPKAIPRSEPGEREEFSPLDRHFADFIVRLSGGGTGTKPLWLAAALVSFYQRRGHICLDLPAVAETPRPDAVEGTGECCPPLTEWTGRLNAARAVGAPGDFCPLILDRRGRLYLYRYWEYQERLAGLIRKRVEQPPPRRDIALLRDGLERLFPGDGSGETDWQKVAAFTALTRRFCVISGGPGTGKTTTVAKILALLLEQNRKNGSEQKLRIALAAPTGKAAARLRASILREKARLDSQVREDIPGETATLHRLLGAVPDSPFFRYNADNRLPADIAVVDEASMVDLALMSKLVQALPDETLLILLGDRDQLASVEAGAVLGDICDTGNVHRFSEDFCRRIQDIAGDGVACDFGDGTTPPICDCIVQLQKSYRFGEESGIRNISREINSGAGDRAAGRLTADGYDRITWHPLPRVNELDAALGPVVLERFRTYLGLLQTPAEAFAAFDTFRILCALRRGPYGVEKVNRLVEYTLRGARLITGRDIWYAGRPVLITRNDYTLRLFNGDVGLTLPDPSADGRLRVFFSTDDGEFRRFNPHRLPAHETVYAMTVHKSQGSEFDHVLLLLPDRDNPVLTRELLYTGITRAIHQVSIWTPETVFRNAVIRTIRRTSGLRDALWGKDAGMPRD